MVEAIASAQMKAGAADEVRVAAPGLLP
jgi:hypothetical protein